MVPPKQIPDPDAKKPEDWVDEPDMDDPEDKKPEGYDDIPARIPDPDAKKPADWDDETDGEWEAPTIDNPAYHGPWHPKRIPNPAYKGAWVHPMIANPDYKPNPELYAFDSFKHIAIEIWQVKAGSIYDNLLVTDDEDVAAEWAKKWEARKSAEKAMADKLKEEEDKKAAAEAEAAKAAEEAKPAEEVKPVAEEKPKVCLP
jgi:calreticulin